MTEIFEFGDYTFSIKVGKNAQNNWDIITDADPNDWWFHLNDFPSPHVIVHCDEPFKKLPKLVIKKCAVLCKSKSKYANQKKLSIIYTQVKNISFGEHIGSVITSNTKLINI